MTASAKAAICLASSELSAASADGAGDGCLLELEVLFGGMVDVVMLGATGLFSSQNVSVAAASGSVDVFLDVPHVGTANYYKGDAGVRGLVGDRLVETGFEVTRWVTRKEIRRMKTNNMYL